MELAQSRPGGRFDGIAYGECADGHAVPRHKYNRLALPLQSFSLMLQVFQPPLLSCTQEAGLPTSISRPATLPSTPPPVIESKRPGFPTEDFDSLPPARWPPPKDARFAAPRKPPAATVPVPPIPAAGMIFVSRGSSFRQRSGFIDHDGIHLFQRLQSFGIFHQNARMRTAPNPHHDGHGRRQT